MNIFDCDYCGQPINKEDEIIEDGIHYHVTCYNELCSSEEHIHGRCCVCGDWVSDREKSSITKKLTHTYCL